MRHLRGRLRNPGDVAQFELPGSPLVALAPAVLSDSQEPELIVATGNDGILAFNSRAFRQIFPPTLKPER
jgi:hypothetical protein